MAVVHHHLCERVIFDPFLPFLGTGAERQQRTSASFQFLDALWMPGLERRRPELAERRRSALSARPGDTAFSATIGHMSASVRRARSQGGPKKTISSRYALDLAADLAAAPPRSDEIGPNEPGVIATPLLESTLEIDRSDNCRRVDRDH